MNLELRNVSVQVRDRKIVDDVSMKLDGGELVGLIGPNGAGKTTLLKTMIGARSPTEGEILLTGTPVHHLAAVRRARALAYLPQERRVEWHLSARSIVMLGRLPYRTGFGPPAVESELAVDRALADVDAKALAGRRVSELSGGERARVLLARAFAVEAPLLLVDEPIAELDPYHQLHVMEILRKKSRNGVGVLAVIHDLALATRFMDRLILMHDGSVIEDGPPEKVLTRKNLEDVYRVSPLHTEGPPEGLELQWKRIPTQ